MRPTESAEHNRLSVIGPREGTDFPEKSNRLCRDFGDFQADNYAPAASSVWISDFGKGFLHQLAAGSGDVAPTALANERRNSLCQKQRVKAKNSGVIGTREAKLRRSVEWNQIHFQRHCPD